MPNQQMLLSKFHGSKVCFIKTTTNSQWFRVRYCSFGMLILSLKSSSEKRHCVFARAALGTSFNVETSDWLVLVSSDQQYQKSSCVGIFLFLKLVNFFINLFMCNESFHMCSICGFIRPCDFTFFFDLWFLIMIHLIKQDFYKWSIYLHIGFWQDSFI